MSIEPRDQSEREPLAGSLALAGVGMIAAGALLWLIFGESIEWAGALFLAWGVAGGFICFGNAIVEALHLGRREPIPARVRATRTRR